jgi:putative transposase
VTSNTRSRSRARSWAWPDKGYYRWLTDGPSEHDRTDEQLTDQIRKIHAELHGHPGVCRIWAELVVRGVRIGRKRVWRLMRAAGLRGRHRRAWKRTTIAGQRPVDAPDLIGQDFTAADPDTRWVGDITSWVGRRVVIDQRDSSARVLVEPLAE